MKALVDAALLGLGRAGPPAADPDDAGERLAARADGLGPERSVLLRLGVRAIRARAGFVPAPAGERPPPAAADTRAVCSPSLAAIIADLCRNRNNEILGEALARIDARGWRLPPHRLPVLASLREPSLLPAAANVVGERGRWLALHNPAWRWLHGVAPESLDDRKKVWEEGTTEARVAAVRATRQTDPAAARDWITAAWKAEKASLREQMVEALATGLSAEDEPLLMQALADRAAGVRAAAARLLARIETSAVARRARDRAEGLLSYAPPAGGVLAALKSKIAGKSHGALTVTPPAAFTPEWAADGLIEKPQQGTGERAFWLQQILAVVPPRHWEQRFGASPEALAHAVADSEWAAQVLAAWTDAAVTFNARSWAPALWNARVALQPKAPEFASPLLKLMDTASAHDSARAILDRSGPRAAYFVLLEVPRPWSGPLADDFLAALRPALAATSMSYDESEHWRAVLELAVAALPIAALDRALALERPQIAPETARLVESFTAFRSMAATRKQIHQETQT